MTNKATKRALLTSVLALLLCVSMLVGTTYAWFTDSVTSTNNIIKSGNLDVNLYYWDAGMDSNKWVSIEDEPNLKLFKNANGEDILWEPGATGFGQFEVANEGSLALKYQLKLEFYDATATAEGKTLEDVLSIYAIARLKNGGEDKVMEDATLESLYTDAMIPGYEAQSLKDFVLEGYLLPGESFRYELGAFWEPTANDNDYNVAGGLEIKFGVTLLATQMTYEEDSFDDQYDKNAYYSDAVVTNEAELVAALADPDVKVIAISGKVPFTAARAGASTDMGGVTLVGVTPDATLEVLGTGGGLTDVSMKDLSVIDSTFYTSENGENAWEFTYLELEGNNTFENVVFTDGVMFEGKNTCTNCTFMGHNNDSSEYGTTTMYGAWVYDGKATFTGCTFTGTRGLKTHEQYGSEVISVVVKDCTFGPLSEKPGVVIGTLNAATTVSITDSKFVDCQPGDQSKYIYESDTDVTTFNFIEKNNTLATDAKVSSAADFLSALSDPNVTSVSIELTDDIQFEKITAIEPGKEVYLDLNGKTITVDEDTKSNTLIWVKEGAKLVVDGNGTFDLGSVSTMAIFCPYGELVIENGTFIRDKVTTVTDKTTGLFMGAKVTASNVTINGGYFDPGYYDANAADVEAILAGTATLTETADDVAKRGLPGDKNAVRVAVKDNVSVVLNHSGYGTFKVYGGTFVGANPAWGDEGCMLPTTPSYLRPWSYYQGALLAGQTYNENGLVIPEGYTITKGATAEGIPTYTVEYNK